MNPLELQLPLSFIKSLTDAINSDNYNFEHTSVNSLINVITELNKNIYNLTKIDACNKILNCSIEKFNDLLQKHIIPAGHYDNKTHRLLWCENDFINAINTIKKRKQIIDIMMN